MASITHNSIQAEAELAALKNEISKLQEKLFNAEQQVIKAEKSRDRALRIAETHSDQWNEAVLALEASQAREAKLRDFIFDYVDLEPNNEAMIVRYDTCVKPTDDTALKEYRRNVLLEAAERLREVDSYMRLFDTTPEKLLRRMAEEE